MNQPKITQNKNILGGKPTIAGTRISVDLLISYLSQGMTVNDIKYAYPHLTDAQITAALEYMENSIKKEKIKLGPVSSQV